MPPAGNYRWVILGIVFLAQLSTSLSSLAVAPLAPILQTELNLSKTQIGLFSAASFAGTWVIVLLAGALTDRHGVRRLMSLGQVIIAVFMFGMAAVGSLSQAIVVMFGAGIGCGVVPPSLSKSVTDWFPRRSRGLAMGLKQAGVPVGGVITATTLPVIALAIGWRPTMALVGAWVAGAAIVTAVFCREIQRPASGGAPALPLLAGLQTVIRNRRIWSLSAVSVLYVTAQMGLLTYLALFMEEVVLVRAIPEQGPRIVAAGGYLALCQVGGTFGRIFWGVASDRLFRGRRMPVLAIIGGLSAVASLMVASFGPDSSLLLISVVVFVCGATAVGWNGLYQASITESVDRRHAATGVGFSMTLSQVGTVGGPPLFGLVVDASGSFQVAWIVLSCFCLCGLVMSVLNSRWEKAIA